MVTVLKMTQRCASGTTMLPSPLLRLRTVLPDFSTREVRGRRTQQPLKAEAGRLGWKVRANTLAGWEHEEAQMGRGGT